MRSAFFRFLHLTFLVILVCGFAVANETDIHIIMDPGVTPSMLGNLYELDSTNTEYNVTWLNCSAYSSFNPAPSYDACLGIFNNTGASLSTFEISFTVPSSGPGSELAGQPITCSVSGVNLIDNTCPSGNLVAGDTYTVSFFGGTPIANETAFFIGEDGVDCDNAAGSLLCTTLPAMGVTADPTPEPSTLAFLLEAGLLGGVVMGLKRLRSVALL